MKKNTVLVLSLLFALAATAATAQPRLEVIARAVWMDPTGDAGGFDGFADDFVGEFDSETGFGVALNYFISDRISAELGVSVVEPDLEVTLIEEGSEIFTGSSEMVPFTAALQYHFAPAGRFDFYLGAGAAYVVFDDVISDELIANDVRAIEFDDELGVLANAGISIGAFGNLTVNVDAKYIDLEPEASVAFERGDFVSERAIEFSPLLVSAGIGWRF
jgi:outer membrane protein